tara:strand:- start:5664 stop:7169 length:1506 start_codon:yes stop_codon:yes gene_type:complete
MAETTSTSYQLPPQYIQDLLAGGAEGSGVPGLFPLINQSMVNQFENLNKPGGTPYTYEGQRIAPFSQREQEAFRLSDNAIGSYLPYLRQQEDLYGRGTALGLEGLKSSGERLLGLEGLQNRGFNQAQNFMTQGTDQILGGANTASNLARAGSAQSLAGLGNATSTARGAYGLLGSQLGGGDLTARGTLQDAARTSLGSAGMFDPSSASSYMNPFEDQVVQQALEDVRNSGALAGQQASANAIGSGAFGGSRSRLLSSELAEAQRRAEIETAANLRSSGYSNALTNASNSFENQQRRQAGSASQLGNIAGGLGSLAGQQATAGQNLANQYAGYGQSAGANLANLGATEGTLGQIRGGALSGLGSNISALTGQRVGLGQNIASGLGTLGMQGGTLLNQYGSQLGNIGNNLGNLQRQDINLLSAAGGTNRNMQQGINDLNYQNFTGQYNLPQQLLGQYSGIAQGIAPLAGGTAYNTTATPGVSYMTSALGGLTNALGETYRQGG